jgi:ABC-type sugar transport system substrate-binding protein
LLPINKHVKVNSEMKKIAVIVLVLMFAAVSGCISVDSKTHEVPPEDGLRITFITPLYNHPIWDAARDGFEQAAKDFNFGPEYLGPQYIDPGEMVNLIDKAVASKVDGVITMPIDPVPMRGAFEKCDEAGIPVVFVGSVDPLSTSLAYVGTDTYDLGRTGAAALMEKFNGEPIKAVIMQSTADASFAIESRDGYLEAFADYPDFEMVVNDDCNSDMVIAMRKYERIFREHPEINTVIGVCGEAGPAAARVVENMGLADSITIIAIDDIDEIKDLIEQEKILGTMAQNYYQIGYKSAQILVENLRSGKTPDNYSYYTGSIFVDNSNMDTYMNDLKAD